MKRLILLLTLFCLALLPTASFANLLLQLPPIFAGASFSKDVCTQYSCYPCYPACTEDPCQPCVDCDASKECDPCKPETCDNRKPCHDCEDPTVCAKVEGAEACIEGPCYPACTEDPCQPCVDCDASTSCNPCKPETCVNNKPCDPCVQCDSKCDPCQPETCENNKPCDPCVQCDSTCDPCQPETCELKPCYPCIAPGMVALNDTGIIAKKADHDDSQYGRDLTHNDPSDGHAGFSFEKISTCIRDKVTGLTWSPDLGTSSWTGTSTVISNNSTLCGLTDWRLPTIQELVSIVSYHRIDPAIDNDATRAFFNDTQSSNYWTSTANAADSSKRWAVNFAKGKAVNHIMESDDSGTIRVRLVRAEEAK